MSKRILVFVGVAYLITWVAWLPLVGASLGWFDVQPTPYLHLVGGMGPAIAALALSAMQGRDVVAQLLRRCTSAPVRWVALAIGAPVALYFAAAGILLALGYEVDLASTGASTEYPQLSVGVYVLANVIGYGFGEELGWRGYVLPRLQRRFSAAHASLIVSAIWALWHLPLFAFSPGMSSMGAGGTLGWAVSIVSGSFLMTAMFNASRGSVLVVAIFHGVLDVLMTSPTGGPLQSTMGALIVVAGLTIPFRFGVSWVRPARRGPEPAPVTSTGEPDGHDESGSIPR